MVVLDTECEGLAAPKVLTLLSVLPGFPFCNRARVPHILPRAGGAYPPPGAAGSSQGPVKISLYGFGVFALRVLRGFWPRDNEPRTIPAPAMFLT